MGGAAGGQGEGGLSVRQRHLRTVVGLVFFAGLGAFCGACGVPFTLDALAARLVRLHATHVLPASVDCRPVAIRLTASSDILQTVYTFQAFLENWRGDLITSVRGLRGDYGCPAMPAPEWSIDPPIALYVQPHFPHYAEFYPQGAVRDSRDYTVTVKFKLADGDVLTASKNLHLPPRRNRHAELARRILAGPVREQK